MRLFQGGIMKYLLSILLLVTSIVSYADNLNNRQRRLSAVYLSQTQIGQEILQQNSLKHQFFDKYYFGDITPKLTAIYNFEAENGNITSFTVNGLLLGASPIYLSWTLAYTLKHYEMYEMASSYNFDPSINFLEKEMLAFATAAVHWKQLGSLNEEDFIEPIEDRPEDIRNHIQASAQKFDQAYKRGKQSFKIIVEKRFFKFNSEKLTAEDLLNSNDLSEKQKQYVLEILNELEQTLKL